MKPRILSIITGLLTGFLLISSGEYLTGKLFPLPKGINFSNKAELIAAANKMPATAFLLLLAIYGFASFAVGLTTTLVLKRASVANNDMESRNEKALSTSWRPAIICSLVFTLGGIINATALNHPLWFVLANVPVYVLPSYLGYILMNRK